MNVYGTRGVDGDTQLLGTPKQHPGSSLLGSRSEGAGERSARRQVISDGSGSEPDASLPIQEQAMRTGSDPITEDEAELDARADEAEREQRWAEFVLDIARWGHVRTLRCATALYDKDPPLRIILPPKLRQIVMNFQESEGWGGVFSAIARAIREHDDETTK